MKIFKKSLEMLSRITNKSFQKLLAQLHNEAAWIIDFLLDDYGINPVIVGGLAVQYHGYRRFTEDIDILLSREDYDKLVEDNKIKFGQLKLKPGLQIDVLTEGKDNNPDPDFVRDGNSNWPTLEGLIYLKLVANRVKDQADIVELIKSEGGSEGLLDRLLEYLPEEYHTQLSSLFNSALKEL